MDQKAEAKQKLADLIFEYDRLAESGEMKGLSDQTARTWVERLLKIFGWDPSDPRQIIQEYRIRGRAARRLKAEDITHNRPDYCLLSHGRRTLYLDAKKFEADLKDDSRTSFQVRSYGWSESFRASYACCFTEFAVYDCRLRPKDSEEADIARVQFLRRHEYLDHFDLLWDLLAKEAIDGGSLLRRFSDDERPKGSKTLDEDFEDKLSSWRKELAKSIIRHGQMRDPAIVSAASQRILDRIVFLRLCEEFGFEEWTNLDSMAHDEDGFWPLFLEEHEKRYIKVYDGILFPAAYEDDPSGVDEHIRSWWLKGKIFREIVDTLYYPSPYRFDVIPLELIGGIYERYLGKRLRITGASVADEFKPEYQRTKGAIYTPPWIVRRVVEKTLSPFVEGKGPETLLRLRVLDPACGSAGFLLGVFDYLEDRIMAWFAERPSDRRRPEFVADTDDGPRLAPDKVKHIINHCLFGVDIDAEAVEVARMSLALRYAEKAAPLMEGEPQLFLQGIGLNIRQGNSLVGPDVAGLGLGAENIVRETMPFDWKNPVTGFGQILKDGGFDAVVGNPPYIEVKRYREWMPAQYQYLKESGAYETTRQGKTDVAMPFMERGLKLLREGGRLGFIIQNRFFKTDYGESVRNWLKRERAVEEIEDFRDLQVFPGRTTYTAIMVLRQNSADVHYRTYGSLADAQANAPSVVGNLPWDVIDANVWSFDQPDLLDVYRDLAKKHPLIGHHPNLQISVGLQTLYGRFYQLEPREVKPRMLVGINGDGEEVTLEKAAMRPLCRNRGFYPFRPDNADAWVIFPYEIINGEAREIPWKEFKERFTRAADYLEKRKRDIRKAVETEKGPKRWHLYKYPKNLVSQTMPKVLFPSTIEDMVAAVDEEGDVYQDNVRINSISFANACLPQLKALAAVFNSSSFNALAKCKAGLLDSGWRQMNKQFLELVPLPTAVMDDEKVVKKLSSLAEKIKSFQSEVMKAASEGEKTGLRAVIEDLWRKLDDAVGEVYGLTREQKKVLARYPRRVNRFDLLTRQAPVPEEE